MPTKKDAPQWGDKLNSDGIFKQTSKLADGQSIIGTVLAFREGQYGTNVVMNDEAGQKFTLAPSGNLKYNIKDGMLKIGLTYKITKEGTKLVKGKPTGVFGVYPSKNQPAQAPAENNEEI